MSENVCAISIEGITGDICVKLLIQTVIRTLVKSVHRKTDSYFSFYFFNNQNICCGYSKEPSQ